MKTSRSQVWPIWALVYIIVAVAGSFWIFDELAPDRRLAGIVKLLSLLLLVSGGAAFMTEMLLRRVECMVDAAASAVNALPNAVVPVTAAPDPIWEPLSHAMDQLAQRVTGIVEKSGREAAHRDAILACMAEGVLAVDAEMRILLCNTAFAKAFGASSRVQPGRLLFEVVREPLIRDILEDAVRQGEASRTRVQLPTANNRWFQAKALPLVAGAKQGAVIVLHDVTDIEHQERIRKDFVADVSHEFRTPLTAIRGYAETLLDGALNDPENNRKFVEIILSHAIRLNNIAADLLVLSDIDANTPVPAERVSVLAVVESAVDSIQNAAAARDVVIDTTDCHDSAIMGQRFRLEQVISNLLDNAVKFNRPSGVIKICCKATSDNRVLISVSDTGIGIPQTELNRIFERFYRVDKSRSRPAGGTGLGLPIVKEVVERMGGSVSVESQLNKGSAFHVTLPRA